jgi:hypothetical protein
MYGNECMQELSLEQHGIQAQPAAAATAPASAGTAAECVRGPLSEQTSSKTGRSRVFLIASLACTLVVLVVAVLCCVCGDLSKRGGSMPWQYPARENLSFL